MTYVSAGHRGVFRHFRPGQRPAGIPPTRQMLGVARGMPPGGRTSGLQLGDTLFCYTDGITKVRSNGDQFGYERLYKAVSDAPPGDSRAIMRCMMDGSPRFGASTDRRLGRRGRKTAGMTRRHFLQVYFGQAPVMNSLSIGVTSRIRQGEVGTHTIRRRLSA